MTGLAVNDGILVVYRVGSPAATLTVTETGDEPDANTEDGVCDADAEEPGEQCTLRAAIETANAEGEEGRIVFDVGADALGGAATIALQGALPPLTVPVEIDAAAAPARSPAEAAARVPGPLAGPLPDGHPVPPGMRRGP
jgi:CSLREA domain-containing protein